jgi:L-malate glycosyltransferase
LDPSPPTIVEALYSYEIGGGERIATDIALGFARRGYRVLCFGMYGNDGPLRAELEQAGLRCHGLSYVDRPRLLRRFTYPLELANFFRQQRVAGLHMHYGTSLIVAGRAARMANVKRVVVTEHALHQYKARPDYLSATRKAVRFADAITVVDETQLDFLRSALAVPPSVLQWVPNGVLIPPSPTPRTGAYRREFSIADDEFLFAAVSRLHPTKDLTTLIEAFSLLAARTTRRCRLWLIGEGEERPSIEAAIARCGVSNLVQLLGARMDVKQLLSDIDCIAMSSITEGLPMALLEAMATSVPCVATSVGGIPRLLRADAGILVPPKDPNALAEALCAVAEDSAVRAALIARGLARVREEFDIETTISRYLDLLHLPQSWSN